MVFKMTEADRLKFCVRNSTCPCKNVGVITKFFKVKTYLKYICAAAVSIDVKYIVTGSRLLYTYFNIA